MKLFYKILFLSLLFLPKVNAGTGPATEYKITMTLLELCDSTSTLTSCNNPVVIGSGSSGVVDIAGTTAGAAAASYGTLSSVPLGTTFTYMQITMSRAMTITGRRWNVCDQGQEHQDQLVLVQLVKLQQREPTQLLYMFLYLQLR